MDIPEADRTVRIDGEPVVVNIGSEMPWLGPLGACLVKVHEMRRNRIGVVEYGVGNELPPILAWVTSDEFFNEWPQ